MVPPNNLGPDLAGKSVNETSYRGMIGSLMYLTATRPDIEFSIVLCARYQSNPKESHLIAVKRILRYLKGTPTLGPYYPKCLGFDLKGYSDSDNTGCNMDRKSTLAKAEYVAAVGCCASILWMKSQLSYYDIHYKMNFLREFWSTAVAFDPFPSTDEPEKCPLKEFIIKFSVSNGQRPLTLDFKTFCSSTGLGYNNGKYVDHPIPEVVKKELGKIAINPSYLDKTPVLKNSFPMAWRILFTFVIQVLDGNYSSTKQVNSIQQLLACSLNTRTEVDIREIIYSDLVTKLLNKSRLKYVSYPRFISCALQVLLGGNIPPADMEPIHNPVADLLGTAILLSEDEAQESDEEVLDVGDDMDEDPQDDKEVRTPSPKQDQPEPYLRKISRVHFKRITKKQWEQHEEAAVSYADLKASVDQYYDENIAHRDQTDKIVEASMSSLDRSSTTNSDLYKGLNVITQLLKEISNVVKVDPATNQKLNEATETFTRISSNVTKVLSLVKGFDFSALLSTVKSIQDHAVKQEEASAAWMKTSTNMAWNLGSRLSGVELSQTALKREISSLKKDTFEIKSMMTKMYATFQGHPSSAPLGSVTPTLALTDIQANVEGENANTTVTEEPPSHTEGETKEPRLEIPISSIPSISDDDLSKKLVKASSIVRPDPNEPVRVKFVINGKIVYLTEQEIQDYWDKEEQIKKAKEEAMLLVMTKYEVIKVVQEEAEKIRLDPKAIKGVKFGEMFKKAQDAKHAVLKRQYTKKVRKSLELRKHKSDSYMWTVSGRLKPEPIIDIKIYPKTKPVVITVYRGTNGRNFEVHEPFLFGAFGISELDELREIIPKKKIAVSALPVPEQTPSQVSGRKWKLMELEPKTRIPGLECNRALPENIPFVNNSVIEEPEYGIFFTDEFGDQAFQRWTDIDKVGMEALVSYLVAASLVKSPKNARFNMKLRKLIVEHPDQEKLKSKKVKLEALGYNMD
ncbi:hypothetical protein Tco_1202867 [Tanacetum coccineum]